jgi:formyltetrahydrofolate deformylase
MSKYVLTIACPDTTGLVAAVSGFLRDNACFIDDSSQYGDPATQRFFMRAVFTRSASSPADLDKRFAAVAAPLSILRSVTACTICCTAGTQGRCRSMR